MAQVINTNIASLNAQRNLNVSQSSLATSLQRLSSGLRINLSLIHIPSPRDGHLSIRRQRQMCIRDSINTNIASLNAQRNLNVSQSSLATSLQRLSSGLRIN